MNSGPVIAVAGGGIAGLTSALCLQRRGFRVQVFEKNAGPSPYGAGIQVSPNAYKVLAGLGLEHAVQSVGFAPQSVDIHNGINGKPLTHFSLGETATSRHGAPYLVLHRADLAQILHRACEETEDIEVLFDHSVDELKFQTNGVVVVAHTQSGSIERDYAAVVGADGVWSNLRRFAKGAAVPEFTGRIAWRALVPSEALDTRFSRTSTGLWLGPKAHVVHYPLNKGRTINVVAITPTPQGLVDEPRKWQKTDNTDSRLAAFHSWTSAVQDIVSAEAVWGGWPLYRVKRMTKCATGSLCLIGDAAHATEPYAAQGGACAIEDADVLAEACATERDDLDVAFLRYEQVRRDRVNKVLALTQANRRVYHLQFPATLARDLAMKCAPQERLQQRMDWLYGWENKSDATS